MPPEEQTVEQAMAHLNEVYRLQDEAIAQATRAVERRFRTVIREAQEYVSDAQRRALIDAAYTALGTHTENINGL
ncbi:hypothetical protein SEA_MOLIVIA_84 [Arthrobacter phage Molivia]|uniref:Uncharacterized protein n=1 Tax=Arthrobacter phage Molivia TaxID=2015839 RepID=A0A286S283_9CAUD|nr:hypothetical protein FDI28_gp32 [Arthrobacter phage Molivia]ASX99305.1 hypothetical protein SEA_MOLIVIA_84 [Arthrobacter phage Molivia]